MTDPTSPAFSTSFTLRPLAQKCVSLLPKILWEMQATLRDVQLPTGASVTSPRARRATYDGNTRQRPTHPPCRPTWCVSTAKDDDIDNIFKVNPNLVALTVSRVA